MQTESPIFSTESLSEGSSSEQSEDSSHKLTGGSQEPVHPVSSESPCVSENIKINEKQSSPLFTEKQSVTPETCDFCGRKLLSVNQLLEHVETEHGADYLHCPSCKYRCSSKTHLSDHIASNHPNLKESSTPIIPDLQPPAQTGAQTASTTESSL